MKRLLLLFTLCFSSNIYALGNKGHWLVCQLAVEKLSKVQQDDLANLFAYFPLKQKHQLNAYLNRQANTKVTFADACSWADAVRNNNEFLIYKNWHYLNVKREQIEVEAGNCQDNCIIDAITFHQQQYNEARDPVLKIQALLFLAHWIGDIHQPLHVSFKSDLGGNKTKVVDKLNSTQHKCKNLHQVWDSCLLANGSKKLMLQNLNHSFKSSTIDVINTNNIMLWANQSLAISRSKSILYCQNIDKSSLCMPKQEKIIFDQEYYKLNKPILIKQIKLAAMRLNLFLSKHL